MGKRTPTVAGFGSLYLADAYAFRGPFQSSFCRPQPFQVQLAATADPDKKLMLERLDAAVSAALQPLQAAMEANATDEVVRPLAQVRRRKLSWFSSLILLLIIHYINCCFFCCQVLLESSKDLLADWLDKQFGSQVTENSIFFNLPKFWEEEYHKDMEALNVRE